LRDVPPLLLSFEDFWPDFDPNSFFVPFVSGVFGTEAITVNRKDADLVFSSVFPRTSPVARARRKAFRLFGSPLPNKPLTPGDAQGQKRIFFTGENRRPPLANYDLSFSFDTDVYDGSNHYFPLVMLGLDWFGNEAFFRSSEFRRVGISAVPDQVASRRSTNVHLRKKFVCAFISNPEPTRMRAIKALESIGQVDVFGVVSGKKVEEKLEIAREYRFMLCFENDLYPGYVTEKPLEAWLTGCIPLWWGNDKAGILNDASMLNLANYSSLASFVSAVEALNGNQELLLRRGSQPLFRQVPSLLPYAQALRRLMPNFSIL